MAMTTTITYARIDSADIVHFSGRPFGWWLCAACWTSFLVAHRPLLFRSPCRLHPSSSLPIPHVDLLPKNGPAPCQPVHLPVLILFSKATAPTPHSEPPVQPAGNCLFLCYKHRVCYQQREINKPSFPPLAGPQVQVFLPVAPSEQVLTVLASRLFQDSHYYHAHVPLTLFLTPTFMQHIRNGKSIRDDF